MRGNKEEKYLLSVLKSDCFTEILPNELKNAQKLEKAKKIKMKRFDNRFVARLLNPTP